MNTVKFPAWLPAGSIAISIMLKRPDALDTNQSAWPSLRIGQLFGRNVLEAPSELKATSGGNDRDDGDGCVVETSDATEGECATCQIP